MEQYGVCLCQSDKTSLGYWSVKDDFEKFGSPGRFADLIVFFPVLLVSEILLAPKISSPVWRIILVLQGLLGFYLLPMVFFWMTFEFWFEPTPVFYVFEAWVIGSCILSILAGLPKLNQLVLRARGKLSKQSV